MNRPWILAFALCACTLVGFGQAKDSYLQRGIDLLRHQRFAEALRALQQAEQAHPGSVEIENFLGITLTQLNRMADADAHYRRAIVLGPKLAGPHKNLGHNLMMENHPADAEPELNEAIRLDGTDPFPHYYLAMLDLSASRDLDAVQQLPLVGDLFANDPQNATLMALACLRTNHTAEAVKLVDLLAAKQQMTGVENYQLGVAFAEKHLDMEAVKRFRAASAADPTSWAARYNFAVALLHSGDADQSLTLLPALAEEQPTQPEVLSMLGLAYESHNQLPQALDAYRRAVQADPQNPDRTLDYTRLLMDLGRTEEATKVVEQGIQDSSAGEDPYALDLRLGVLRLKQGRYDEARAAIDDAIALHPELVVGYVAKAQSYMQQGSDEKALEPLMKARSSVPQDATLEYYVGLVQLRLGHLADAEAALKKSERLRPDVVESHDQLGKLYSQTDRLPQAQAEFERVIALAPANSNAHYQLSRIYARLGETKQAAAMADETRRLMQTQREAALQRQRSRLAEFKPTQ